MQTERHLIMVLGNDNKTRVNFRAMDPAASATQLANLAAALGTFMAHSITEVQRVTTSTADWGQ